MKKSGVKRKNNRKKIRDLSGLALFCCLLVSMVGITLAFFISSDYSSSFVSMSGPVNIQAVDKDGKPIETNIPDDEDEDVSKLVISLSDGFDTIIPGMPIAISANCKVYQSETMPLLRAKFELKIYKDSETEEGVQEEVTTEFCMSLAEDISDSMDLSILASGNWLKYDDDGYYYYKGTNEIANIVGDTELLPVNAKSNNVIVDFLSNSVTMPTGIDSTMSGYYINVSIVFEAIQDFIPNSSGIAIDNTITNSKLIFDDTWESVYGQQ